MTARNSRLRNWACWGVICLAGVVGCEDASPQVPPPIRTAKTTKAVPDRSKSPQRESSSDATGTTEREYRKVSFQVPNAWEEKSPRNPDVIAGEFVVPGDAGPARLTLSTATGGMTANIDRWKDQFQPAADSPAARESTLSIDGRDATLVELFGTFRDTFGGGEPQRDWALLGAVIPRNTTDGAFFVKLTGPRETLEAVRETFIKFVESADFKE